MKQPWPVKPLGEIATIVMGQSPPGETYNTDGEGLPFFQGKAEFTEESPVVVKWCSAPSRIAKAGDILLSVRAPVGPTNIASQRCCIGRGLAAVRAKQGVATSRYIRYFLRRFEDEIATKGVGSTFTAINRRDIERLPVPFVPLAEQERIVKLLDAAEELRRLRAEADRRTADLIPAIFHEMFGGSTNEPRKWDLVPVSEVAQVQSGLQVTPQRQLYPLVRPYLRVANVQRGTLILDEIKEIGLTENEYKRVLLQKDDLLLVEGNGNPEEIGRAALWDGSVEGCVHQNHLIRVRCDLNVLAPEYLLTVLNTGAGKQYFKDSGNTTSGLVTISTSIVKRLEVPLPPIALQRQFAARVAEVHALEAQQSASRQRLDDLFQSMLHRAFRGEW